jgi:hypothetical protein
VFAGLGNATIDTPSASRFRCGALNGVTGGVLAGTAGKKRQVAARLADESWETLPTVPIDGDVPIGSLKDSVPLAGVACSDDACSSAKLATVQRGI